MTRGTNYILLVTSALFRCSTKTCLVHVQFTDADGFRTRSMLCMPVYNSERKITAVTQLINKLNKQPFNDSDANIIEVGVLWSSLLV